MRCFLDAHTLIWAVDDPPRLTPTAAAALRNAGNELLISAATLWEIGIKFGLKKLSLSMPYRQWTIAALADLGATIVPITIEYTDLQAGLPNHHRDPFDRMLVAQATIENVPVISGDTVFDRYAITRLW